MNVICRLIGLNLTVLLLIGLLVMGGNTRIYLDVPGLVFVVGLLVGGLLISFRPQQIGDAVFATLAGESAPPSARQKRRENAAVFGRAYQLAWGAGLVGTLFGLIAMLADLSDPAAIGVGMSVALLTTAYGAMLAEFVFAPLQQSILSQPTLEDVAPMGGGDSGADAEDAPKLSGATGGLWRGLAIVALMVAVFMVPIASFSEVNKEDNLRPDEEARFMRYIYGDATDDPPIAPQRIDEPGE